jgi:prolyl-tRNA synthetase
VEAETMLNVYADFAENWMAMPVLKGTKSPNERFAGALETYCVEALMQDGKALQAGTSHFLGQNFAKAFDVKYLTKENKLEYVWATSWGVSTRLVGALIMCHSDDNGLVLPPKLAPIQVAIVPIFKTQEQLSAISEKIRPLISQLNALGISVKYDDRDNNSPGWKFSEYEFKGVPVRLAVGPRDLENGTIEMARRDTLEKMVLPMDGICAVVNETLDAIQKNLFERALKFRGENSHMADNWDEFRDIISNKGGFVYAHWDGTAETEQKIKDETKATIRCIPLNNTKEQGKCIYSGKLSDQRVVFAVAY